MARTSVGRHTVQCLVNRSSSHAVKRRVDAVKPFSAVPQPNGLPVLGTLLDFIRSGSASKLHEYITTRHHQLGPIFYEKIGNSTDHVFVADPEVFQEILAQEGKYPRHVVPESWRMYLSEVGIERGLFFLEGEPWWKARRVLNEFFLNPKRLALAAPSLDAVVQQHIVEKWRCKAAGGKELESLDDDLCLWSIASLGVYLFGPSFTTDASELQRLVAATQRVMELSAKLMLVPPKLARTLKLPVWKKFFEAFDEVFFLSKTMVSSVLANSSDHETGGIIQEVIARNLFPQNVLESIIIDIVLAAIDTTTCTVKWCLHLLSRRPQLQETILEDLNLHTSEEYSLPTLARSPLIKGVIREALRLNPVAPFLTRYMPCGTVLAGYEIPPDVYVCTSLYTMGRNPKYFPEPNEFVPSRWIRHCPTKIQPFTFLPFGAGPRLCIGMRLTELNMALLIIAVIRNFELVSLNAHELSMTMRLVAVPDGPIRIKINERTPLSCQ